MPPQPTGNAPEKLSQIIAEARRNRELADKTYREQALKLFPGSVPAADANSLEKN